MCESFLLLFFIIFVLDESVVLGLVLIVFKVFVIFKVFLGFEGGGIFVSILMSIFFFCIR